MNGTSNPRRSPYRVSVDTTDRLTHRQSRSRRARKEGPESQSEQDHSPADDRTVRLAVAPAVPMAEANTRRARLQTRLRCLRRRVAAIAGVTPGLPYRRR